MTNAQTVKTELTFWQRYKKLDLSFKIYAGYGMWCFFMTIMNFIALSIRIAAS